MDYNKLKQLAISDSGFIFNPLSGDTYNVNKTGVFIISELKNEGTLEKVIGRLQEEFEVNKFDAQRDLEAFINQLETYGLV